MSRTKNKVSREEIAAKKAQDLEAAYRTYFRRERLARGRGQAGKQSIRHLAREYGVPNTTLQRRINGGITAQEFN